MSEYTLIIPVRKIEGNLHLDKILKGLENQSLLPKETHVIVGDCRQGRAINFGVSRATTKYIATLDDDTQIDDPDLFKKLLRAMDSDNSIGMAGTACLIPDNATSFQKKAMTQISRRFFPVQKENIDSDIVQHPCFMMPRELFLEIGGENEQLIRGLDPVLRKKVRDAGKRVTVVADTWISHLIPDGLGKLLEMYFRNGSGSGYASKYFPELVLELTDGYDKGSFIERRSLFYRIFRKIYSFCISILTFKFVKSATDIAYVFGVLKGSFAHSSLAAAPNVKEVILEKRSGFRYDLLVHQVILEDSD